MPRRIHASLLHVGDIPLTAVQAHHARVVLRLADETEVEIFDDAGNVAAGVFVHGNDGTAFVRVAHIDAQLSRAQSLRFIVISAVPKGDRADWMVEKLSELGAESFIPLAAERSVVLPEGRNKRERWTRLATESAKQSRRAGVMRVEELTSLDEGLRRLVHPPSEPGNSIGWFFSTESDAIPLADAVKSPMAAPFPLFVGPEGGWTPGETELMRKAGLTPVGLTTTILRIETAAVAAAALVAVMGRAAVPPQTPTAARHGESDRLS